MQKWRAGRCAIALVLHPEMACGCVVAGYHGHGGKEFFDPAFSRPIEAGDISDFARAVEGLLAAERDRPGTLQAVGQRAAAFVREHYSPRREEENIAAAWVAVGEKCRRPALPK